MLGESRISPLSYALSIVAKTLSGLCMLLLCVISGAVLWQVLSRYVSATSAPWAQELASYSFVWLVMFAVALAVRRGAHMKLDIWSRFRSGSVPDRVINTVVTLITGAILLSLGWYAIGGLDASFSRTAPGLGISFGWVALAVPVGMALSLIFLIEVWMKSFQGRTMTTDVTSSSTTEGQAP